MALIPKKGFDLKTELESKSIADDLGKKIRIHLANIKKRKKFIHEQKEFIRQDKIIIKDLKRHKVGKLAILRKWRERIKFKKDMIEANKSV